MAAISDLYCPRQGSLSSRVCDFFVRNPDEELTVEDVLVKFHPQGTYNEANQTLRHCVRFGFLATSVRNGNHWRPITHYSAGPELMTTYLPRSSARDARFAVAAAKALAKYQRTLSPRTNEPFKASGIGEIK